MCGLRFGLAGLDVLACARGKLRNKMHMEWQQMAIRYGWVRSDMDEAYERLQKSWDREDLQYMDSSTGSYHRHTDCYRFASCPERDDWGVTPGECGSVGVSVHEFWVWNVYDVSLMKVSRLTWVAPATPTSIRP